MSPPTIHRSLVEANGIRLFCRDTGSDRPPMLLLHGKWGRGETWIDVLHRYHDRYRLLAPDQRGHGLSDKPAAGYRSEDLAADAHGLLGRLGCRPAIVVGHSLGGRVAAYLAAAYPEDVRALAILDIGPDGRHGPPAVAPTDDGVTGDWPLPYPSYADALAHLQQRWPRATNVRYWLESLVETVDGYDYLFCRRAMTALVAEQRDWKHLLPQLRCPILIVRAAESWCLSAAEAARLCAGLSDCTYGEVSGSDHVVYADNPPEFYAHLDAFLARL